MNKMTYLSELLHAQLEQKKPQNIPDGISLEELVEVAHRSHMDYLVLGGLLKTELEEEKKEKIRPYVIQSTMITLTQMVCLRDLEKKFEEARIYNQVLKGGVLKYLYPSPEMREMSDIDIMVYDENLDRAKKVVEEMGFTLLESVKHHDIYVKHPFLIIELHHTLYDKEVDKNQFHYFENKKKMSVKDGKRYALKFQTEDFYVYLIAHMAKHFYETGCGIRNVLDVYYYRQLYEESWDDAIIKNELKKCGLEIFENRIYTLARVWLEGQEVDAFSKILFDYMMECGIYGKGENGVWAQIAKQSMNQDADSKSYVKKFYYFPPLSYMKNYYPWLKKAPYLIGVAWGLRSIHGLLSKEGRKKRTMLLTENSEKVDMLIEIYKGMELDFNK